MDLCEETYNIWSNVSNKTQCTHHCIWCCCHWCQMGRTDFSPSIHMIILRLLCWSFSSCSLKTLPSTLSLLLKCSILFLPTNQEGNSSCQIAKKPIYMPCMWSWRKMRVLYGRIQVCSLYHVCRNCRFLQMGFQCFCHRQACAVSDCLAFSAVWLHASSSSELPSLLLHVPNFAAAAAVLWDGLMS